MDDVLTFVWLGTLGGADQESQLVPLLPHGGGRPSEAWTNYISLSHMLQRTVTAVKRIGPPAETTQ